MAGQGKIGVNDCKIMKLLMLCLQGKILKCQSIMSTQHGAGQSNNTIIVHLS